eukprot:m.275612 g.275612  ORF g.275612 m.275612 type:complete len:69 (+) comp104495_c0_seq1:42-248(+)
MEEQQDGEGEGAACYNASSSSSCYTVLLIFFVYYSLGGGFPFSEKTEDADVSAGEKQAFSLLLLGLPK